MSKAFTKDEGAASMELVRRAPPSADGGKRYLTPEGAAAMRGELERLLAERPRLAKATSVGAPAQLAELEARAAFLQATLDATTVPEIDPERDRAYFGAWVDVEDEDGNRSTYRLVGPDEADAKAGLISIESPLGRALLGKEPGDEATVDRPRGRLTLTISGVRYRPA